jgi:hypothetical protein
MESDGYYPKYKIIHVPDARYLLTSTGNFEGVEIHLLPRENAEIPMGIIKGSLGTLFFGGNCLC